MNMIKLRVADFSIIDSSPDTIMSIALADYSTGIMVTENASSFAIVVGGTNYVYVPSILPARYHGLRDLVSYSPDQVDVARAYPKLNIYASSPEVFSGYSPILVSAMSDGAYFSAFLAKTQVTETATILVGSHPGPTVFTEIT